MWTWALNWNEIRDDLVIGSCPCKSADLEAIRAEAKATAVLSLQEERCRIQLSIDGAALEAAARPLELTMCNAPLRDFDPAHQRRHLIGAVRALHALLAAGHRTYVHCTAGINRAPLVVLSHLTFVEGQGYQDGLAFIRRGRSQAAPYREAWQGCRADVLLDHRGELERRVGPAPTEDSRRAAEAELLREVFSRPPGEG